MTWKWTPESSKKREQTLKEKYGPDYRRRIAALGGSKRTRGNFGYLKDNDPTKLKEIASKGSTNAAQKRRKAIEQPQAGVRRGPTGRTEEDRDKVGGDETW